MLYLFKSIFALVLHVRDHLTRKANHVNDLWCFFYLFLLSLPLVPKRAQHDAEKDVKANTNEGDENKGLTKLMPISPLHTEGDTNSPSQNESPDDCRSQVYVGKPP